MQADVPVNGSEDHADDDPDRPAKRRRRARTSCRPCIRRKTKCDKQDPCEACTKRGEAKLCEWDTPEILGPVPSDISDRFASMYRKMAMLEGRIAELEGKNSKKKSVTIQEPQTSDADNMSANAGSMSPEFPLPLPPAANGMTRQQPPDEEAEEAAQALEDLALGRKQYMEHGLNVPLPTVGTMENRQRADSMSIQERPSVPPVIEDGAFTTVLLGSQHAKPTSIFVSGERQERAALLEPMPSQELSDTLVQLYFQDLGWIYNVLHRPTFLAECRELFRCTAAGIDRIDPAWLACYYAVLAWSVSTIDPRHPNPAAQYSAEEVKTLPDVWMRACRRALAASEWSSRPQVRAVQAILIMISFNRVSASDEGSAFFFTYLSIAARLTQLLGLHKLGKDPTKMPRNDPAWPDQPCSLRRELAKRIFYFVLSFDAMWCSAAGISQIPMNSFDTDPPLNANDEDLGLNLLVIERRDSELTDTIFAQVHWTLARFQSMAAQLQHTLGHKLDYAAVLQLSTGLQTEITRYARLSPHSVTAPAHRRALVLLPLQNRLLRLHRPFFMRGWSDSRYEPSSIACLQSAFEIASGLETMAEANLHCFWWLFAHGLGAVTVLSMSLLRKKHLGLDPPTSEERNVILRVRSFFERSSTSHMASATIHPSSQQALSIIDRILAATELSVTDARSPGRQPGTPVSATLRAIAASISSGDDSPSAGEVDFGATARALLSDTMLFGDGGDGAASNGQGDGMQAFGGFTWSAVGSPTANGEGGGSNGVPSGFDAQATQRALFGFASDFSPGVEATGLPDWSQLLGLSPTM